DDFVSAMESVYARQNPGKCLDVFRRWYSQAGTPRVRVKLSYDANARACTITLSQYNPPVGIEKLSTPPQPKPPLHIPFALGLLRQDGQAQPITHEGKTFDTIVLELCQEEQSWTFTNISELPVPSLLRRFSAPVIVEFERGDADLALLAGHDSDPFARWEAAQTLATRQLLALVSSCAENAAPSVAPHLVATWRSLLDDASLTAAYKARVLSLPNQRELLEKTAPMDPPGVVQASRHLRAELGQALAGQ